VCARLPRSSIFEETRFLCCCFTVTTPDEAQRPKVIFQFRLNMYLSGQEILINRLNAKIYKFGTFG
jgi:hypothetical protein